MRLRIRDTSHHIYRILKYLSIVIVVTGLAAVFGATRSTQEDRSFETNDFDVSFSGEHRISVASKKSPAMVEIDNQSWSGGVSVTYTIRPSESTTKPAAKGVIRWIHDLDSDGEFDIKLRGDLDTKTSQWEVRSGSEWIVVTFVDKKSKTAKTADGDVYVFTIGTGWIKK